MSRMEWLMADARRQASKYLDAKEFIDKLHGYAAKLTSQQYRTLKGQALAGDIEGAEKGLKKLVADE